jgi:hypothetical protein
VKSVASNSEIESSGVISSSKWRRAWRAFIALHSETTATDIEWVEGFRAAFGIALPAAIGLSADHLVWGILCSFATLWVLMCDVGGAYRQKAVNLVASGLVILVAYIFGGWMILSVPNYIIGMFVWVSAAALIGIAGNAAAQAGMVSCSAPLALDGHFCFPWDFGHWHLTLRFSKRFQVVSRDWQIWAPPSGPAPPRPAGRLPTCNSQSPTTP